MSEHGPIESEASAEADLIARAVPWRSGVIEIRDGKLVGVRRRLGRRVSWWRAKLQGGWWHRWRRGDCCRLYYYQPLSIPDYLTVSFVVSTRQTRLITARKALTVLDEIALRKGSWAIVAQPINLRISDRLMARWGWEAHCTGQPGRHVIKRLGEPFRWSDDADVAAIESIRLGIDDDLDTAIGSASGRRRVGSSRMIGAHRENEELCGRESVSPSQLVEHGDGLLSREEMVGGSG